MEHAFSAAAHGRYSIGIEEELMIVGGDSLDLVNAIEALLAAAPLDEIRPELMESVLEIATKPCPDVPAAGIELRALRRRVREVAAEQGLLIGSAGTHPFAKWEQQRIVQRPRYRDLINALRFVAISSTLSMSSGRISSSGAAASRASMALTRSRPSPPTIISSSSMPIEYRPCAAEEKACSIAETLPPLTAGRLEP